MLRRDSHSITEENDHQKGQRLLTPLHEPTFQVQWLTETEQNDY